MTEPTWHRVSSLANLADGAKAGKYVQGQYIFVLRLGDRVFAYDDKCPHNGASLSDGRFQQGRLTCRHHQWQFDACTGQSVRPPGHKMTSFPVKIENGDIFVKLS